MDAAFAIGDVVQLKSGGPQMTVKYSGAGRTDVIWFDRGTLYERSFLNAVLVMFSPAKGS